MRKLIVVALSFIVSHADAQHQINMHLHTLAKTPGDIFLAGSMNGWNPGDTLYKLTKIKEGEYAIKLLNRGTDIYAYKFTRGSWATVETQKDGTGIENRILNLLSDTSINLTIDEWQDSKPIAPAKNTASRNVHIMDTAFYIPQLKRYRRIWVYLPPGYDTNSKAYPVWYLQDGQNLFNEQTAPFGEWGIDEYLDSAAARINYEVIVVGIDHGGNERMTEYNPYNNKEFGKGEGKAYVKFLAETLKPYIDNHYCTKPGNSNTTIGGSSMGGLISLYAVMKYPKIFGAAAIFSPAFWLAPELVRDIQKSKWETSHQFYFYAGEKESRSMLPDMMNIANILSLKQKTSVIRSWDPEGLHNEAAWRKQFPQAHASFSNYYLFKSLERLK